MSDLSLIVRRTIKAPRQRVFDAWTRADLLPLWWGPEGIECTGFEVDLRPGGHYRIANDDGDNVLWIGGTFEVIEPPSRLVYTWAHEPVTPESNVSRVSVRFETVEGGTEVVIVHDRLTSPQSRDIHEQGWNGCLDGLEGWVGG